MHHRRRLAGVLALSVALGVGVVACSSSNELTGTGPTTSAAPGSTQGTAPPARVPCKTDTLTPVAQKKDAGASLADVVCSTGAAVTTLKSAAVGGEGFALFVLSRDGWELVAQGPMSTDPNAVAPKDFPASLIRTWQFQREEAAKPTTTQANGPTTTDSKDRPPVTYVPPSRVTTTTLPPTTTTTAPPPTSIVTIPPTTQPAQTTTTKPGCDLSRPLTCV